MREEIIKLLDQYRLKEALSQMTGYATHTSDWQLKNELEALQTSYDLMLQYTSKGMKDPNKVEIYHKMLRTAYELADRIHIAVQATQNYGAYYDTMRTFVQSPPHSYAELQMQLLQCKAMVIFWKPSVSIYGKDSWQALPGPGITDGYSKQPPFSCSVC